MNEIIKEFKKGDLLYIGDNKKAYWGLPQGYPYKEGGKTVIEWDGNTDGKFFFGEESQGFCKVSDDVFDNLDGCPITFIAGDEVGELTLSKNIEDTDNVHTYGDGINQMSVVVVFGENTDNLETGTYFFKGSIYDNILYVSKLTVSKETIHPMAPEFLPSATLTTPGAVKQMPYLPNATGDAPTAENFNQLVRGLKSAGLMK